MNPEQISAIHKLLKSPKNIIVIGHKNPDGDAIGSCLGLANFLRQNGHQVTTLMPNDFPKFLEWIPEVKDIIIFNQEVKKSKEIIKKADIIFTLDFNELNRTGEVQKPLEEATCDFVLIDHHQQPGNYATVTYSDVTICSTSQMVYHFMESLNGIDLLNKEIATQLYTGIMTDTGSFRFPATTATTHRVIANLIENGAKNSEIHQHVYDTNSHDRLKLLGLALNNLKILPAYNTAYITLSQLELSNHNFRKGDTEGFVNYALSISGVVFAAIFIENKSENIVKISLRSKGSFSVNEFSRSNFSGGGHTNAAGGKSYLSLDETVKEFINILPNYKKALRYGS